MQGRIVRFAVIEVGYFLSDSTLERKGVSLIIKSNEFKITNNRYFNLSGENGDAVVPLEAVG